MEMMTDGAPSGGGTGTFFSSSPAPDNVNILSIGCGKFLCLWPLLSAPFVSGKLDISANNRKGKTTT